MELVHHREREQDIHTLVHHREQERSHRLVLVHRMGHVGDIEWGGWWIPHICKIVCALPLARELELEHYEEQGMGVQQELEL